MKHRAITPPAYCAPREPAGDLGVCVTADLCDAELIDLDEQGGGHRRDGTAAPRWAPDMQLVPAILMTPRWPRVLTEYVEADRCWIVAGVDLANWSAKEIEHRIGGSERLVRDLRSKPFTELCKLMQSETQKLADQLRLEQIEHVATQHLLRQALAEAKRYRTQRDDLFDQLVIGGKVRACRKGLHAMTEYNTYRYTDGGGKHREICRECNRLRVSKFHARAREAAAEQGKNAKALQLRVSG